MGKISKGLKNYKKNKSHVKAHIKHKKVKQAKARVEEIKNKKLLNESHSEEEIEQKSYLKKDNSSTFNKEIYNKDNP